MSTRARGKEFFLSRLRSRFRRSKLSPVEFSRELASKAGCVPKTIRRALTGAREPSLELLRRLDKASGDLARKPSPKGSIESFREPTNRHESPYPLTVRGSKILKRCEQLGHSQVRLAKLLGQHKSAITDWLYHRVPEGMVLEKLAQVLDVDPRYLVDDSWKQEETPRSYQDALILRIRELESRTWLPHEKCLSNLI